MVLTYELNCIYQTQMLKPSARRHCLMSLNPFCTSSFTMLHNAFIP
ncbi:hypothetical protein OIU74_006190 [Salix koriyanagi]|uniref:Uncharacterized protein n=1 Tax=Salix koriyanagi TaxID=2511006 RepID=A0A9Q0UDI8_9ROSI|nr:hypothetical protein OIU74_006190 [Salix koriyanagi]